MCSDRVTVLRPGIVGRHRKRGIRSGLKLLCVLSVVAITATFACFLPVGGAADNLVLILSETPGPPQPVTLTDWGWSILSVVFGSGATVDNAWLKGTDNAVKSWWLVCNKPVVLGKNNYLGTTQCRTIAVGIDNGWLVWNAAVDNVSGKPAGWFGYGGMMKLPPGFVDRLPRRK